ncbi:MAG: 1-acyl-sn-glycerol-3-phosphate acyltransferase [Syntrophaceae bacterium]|nr:1-acyl-sn-glycerol-3-phosphate acyltransferase [Syntrophaceae bacterium]
MQNRALRKPDEPEEYPVAVRVFAESFPKPLRVAVRAIAIPLWILVCYLAMRVLYLTTIGRPEQRKIRAKKLSIRWQQTMRYLIGIRVFVRGKIPDNPFFLVGNHHTWIDFFRSNILQTARIVMMSESVSFPFAGLLVRGLDPIIVDRKRTSVSMVVEELVATLRRGESVRIAPEGAVTPGHMIRRYHAALLEAAVITEMPAHYVTSHWRTPAGCRPPSQSVIYGPDPYMRDEAGRVLPSELELWGGKRSFLMHLIHLLALPHCDIVARFGPEPIRGEDRVSLAKALHAASLKIFTPSA